MGTEKDRGNKDGSRGGKWEILLNTLEKMGKKTIPNEDKEKTGNLNGSGGER